MVAASNLVVPVVLWGPKAPTHCISACLLTADQRHLVTGCNDGQLIVWDVHDDASNVVPRFMLFGHTARITCLARGNLRPQDKPYIVSSSDNGEMSLWDISDGRCVEHTKLSITHSFMKSYQLLSAPNDVALFCCGFYPEIQLMSATSLEITHTLVARTNPDWISAFCILHMSKSQEDVVVGVNTSGFVSVWTLGSSIHQSSGESEAKKIIENECKQIRTYQVQSLTHSPVHPRLMLIVSATSWHVYDAGDFVVLASVSAPEGVRWGGGDFVDKNKIAVMSADDGSTSLYRLPPACIPDSGQFRHHLTPQSDLAVEEAMLYATLGVPTDGKKCVCPPVTIIDRKGPSRNLQDNSILVIRGDSNGRVALWKVPVYQDQQIEWMLKFGDDIPENAPAATTTLQEVWDSLDPSLGGIAGHVTTTKVKHPDITATIFMASQGTVMLGRSDGSIVVISAIQSIKQQLFSDDDDDTENVDYTVFKGKGHRGKVTALLYPYNDSDRYNPSHALSGGVDFSVNLWNIDSGTLLHTFHVHGGEVLQLLVPPSSCSQRVQNCVCSVARDHSVALLSVKENELKPLMIAGRHLFPVQTIKWRPLDDFLVVGCTDGTVYVWQMETGHLDRVVTGLTADEILAACDDPATVGIGETSTNTSVTVAQAFRRRNLASFKNLAHQTQMAITNMGVTPDSKNNALQEVVKPEGFPLMILGLRSNAKDSESHLLYFDAENLILHMLSEESSPTAPSSSNVSPRPSRAATPPLKPRTGPPGRPSSPAPNRNSKGGPKTSICDERSMTMKIAQMFLSSLHAWGLDPDLDHLCTKKLGLLCPAAPVAFGLLSRNNHMSLMLPGWYRSVNWASSGSDKDASLLSSSIIKPSAEEILGVASTLLERSKYFSSRGHWEISSSITTLHLLSVISVANTLMSKQNATFRTSSLDSMVGTPIGDSEADAEGTPSRSMAQTKQGWSLLAALHCVLLPDLVGTKFFKPTLLEMLAKRWQDRCLEIREASQALLLAELRRIGAEGRRQVVEEWAPHLPSYVDPQMSLLQTEQQANTSQQHHQPSLSRVQSPTGTASGDVEATSVDDDDDEDSVASGVEKEKKRAIIASYESRRKQATAIVMLGVIGSEFGAEIEPNRNREQQLSQQLPQPRKKSTGIAEGFGIRDYSLARHTSKALTFLLLTPPSSRLPANTPIRRAAVDLLGRGFTVWEPYLDVSSVLLGLLELCVEGGPGVPITGTRMPLSPAADSCRTARHALSLIATARPPVFINTMAKEVARFNSLIQQNQQNVHLLANTVLVRSKPEIIRIVELLIDKMSLEVGEHIVQVVDIIAHCLDMSLLKNKGLNEVFPAIVKYSTVSHCLQTRRIAVGGKAGQLAVYDIRTPVKCQMLSAHSAPITAVSFSPDGKFIAAYSYDESKISFWQTASTSLFSGIVGGQQQTRCTKTLSTPTFALSASQSPLRIARLVWVSHRSVILLVPDGTEHKFFI